MIKVFIIWICIYLNVLAKPIKPYFLALKLKKKIQLFHKNLLSSTLEDSKEEEESASRESLNLWKSEGLPISQYLFSLVLNDVSTGGVGPQLLHPVHFTLVL